MVVRTKNPRQTNDSRRYFCEVIFLLALKLVLSAKWGDLKRKYLWQRLDFWIQIYCHYFEINNASPRYKNISKQAKGSEVHIWCSKSTVHSNVRRWLYVTNCRPPKRAIVMVQIVMNQLYLMVRKQLQLKLKHRKLFVELTNEMTNVYCRLCSVLSLCSLLVVINW